MKQEEKWGILLRFKGRRRTKIKEETKLRIERIRFRVGFFVQMGSRWQTHRTINWLWMNRESQVDQKLKTKFSKKERKPLNLGTIQRKARGFGFVIGLGIKADSFKY